jgi:hypothetical protein
MPYRIQPEKDSMSNQTALKLRVPFNYFDTRLGVTIPWHTVEVEGVMATLSTTACLKFFWLTLVQGWILAGCTEGALIFEKSVRTEEPETE